MIELMAEVRSNPVQTGIARLYHYERFRPEWEYEQEWRLVGSPNYPEGHPLKPEGDFLRLPPRALQSVIVGCEADLRVITKVVNEHAPGVPIQTCRSGTQPVVPNSKPEVPLPWPAKRFKITLAGFGILCKAVEDSNGRLPADCPQLGSCGGRPDKPHRKPNSRRISSCEVILPERTSSCARAIAAESASVTGSSSAGADNAVR